MWLGPALRRFARDFLRGVRKRLTRGTRKPPRTQEASENTLKAKRVGPTHAEEFGLTLAFPSNSFLYPLARWEFALELKDPPLKRGDPREAESSLTKREVFNVRCAGGIEDIDDALMFCVGARTNDDRIFVA
jgi:hypothetical protein